MGLSDRLASIVSVLLKVRCHHIRVSIHVPSEFSSFQHIVVIHTESEYGTTRSSASHTNLAKSFIKALAELGEEFICDKYSLACRSGIAGGIFINNAIERAKSELIERDAFFYHYRNRIPFLLSDRSDDCEYFMEPLDPRYFVSLTTNSATSNGTGKCLIFGVGAHEDINYARIKAKEEYSMIQLNHKLFPEICENLLSEEDCKRLTDFHHLSSKDNRNIEIFKALCSGSAENAQNRQKRALNWRIETLESPLRYFKFVRVECDDLVNIEFGIPEKSDGSGRPLYHPFW